MTKLRSILAGLLALLSAATANAQQFPKVPAQSVIGRLGIPGDSGPSQAIPFDTLAGQVGGIITAQRVFSTVADFAAHNVPVNFLAVTTLGHTTVGDNGGASYIRIAPTTAAPWRVQTPDGQWWALNNRILTPEMFGCFSGIDCTGAFAAMSTLINSFSGGGGVVVNFTQNADYKIWPAGTTPSTAIALSGVNGLTFNFNGARISTNNGWTTPNSAVISISNSSGLVFNNPAYACLSCSGAIDFTKYGLFFYITDAAAPWSNNIQINNATQFWGSAFLQVAGDLTFSSQDQAHNISVINADLQHVFYGLSFQGSGDNFFARGVKCTDCGRIYFPWMVSNHDVEMIKSGGGGSYVSVLLATYGYPRASELRRGLSNIKVKYRDDSATAADGVSVGFGMSQIVAQPNVSGAVNNGSGLVRLTVNSTADMATGQIWFVNSVGGITGTTNGAKWPVTVIDATHLDLQGSTFAGTYTSGGYMRVPASLRDISVQVENTLAVVQPTAFATFKFNADSTTDTTTDGHTIENITLSGSLRNYNYGVPALSLFTNNGNTSVGTWVGETIRNIALRDLTITGTNSSAIIDATNIQANLTLQNVWSTPTTVPWTLTGTGANYRPINASGTGITDRLAVEVATAPAHNFLTGLNSSGQFTGAQPALTDISGWGSLVLGAVGVAANTIGGFPLLDGSAKVPAAQSQVASVFGRTGAVVAANGDYAITGIGGLGTGVATAAGINLGTAGALVSNGGALGTPASGIGTNLTGTASGLTAGSVTTNANLTGDVTSVGNTTTLTNASVIAKVLTGYVSGAGTVSATDSILSAFQKINGNDALKAPLASPALTGTPTAPTASPGTNTTQLATTAYADAIAALKANIASPTFTGTPAAPTAAVDTSTTQLATTAMVLGQAASATPLGDGTAAVGTSTRYARGDHVHPIPTQMGVMAVTVTGVDFSSAGDVAIALPLPPGFTRIMPWRVDISGASANISAATFGVFSATGGGGVTLLATGSTAVTTAADATAGNAVSDNLGQTASFVAASLPTPNTLYFRKTATATGTANVTIRYFPEL